MKRSKEGDAASNKHVGGAGHGASHIINTRTPQSSSSSCTRLSRRIAPSGLYYVQEVNAQCWPPRAQKRPKRLGRLQNVLPFTPWNFPDWFINDPAVACFFAKNPGIHALAGKVANILISGTFDWHESWFQRLVSLKDIFRLQYFPMPQYSHFSQLWPKFLPFKGGQKIIWGRPGGVQTRQRQTTLIVSQRPHSSAQKS